MMQRYELFFDCENKLFFCYGYGAVTVCFVVFCVVVKTAPSFPLRRLFCCRFPAGVCLFALPVTGRSPGRSSAAGPGQGRSSIALLLRQSGSGTAQQACCPIRMGGGFPQHQRKSRCPSWRRASAGDLAGDESLSGSLFFLLFRKDEVEDDGHDEHYGDAVLGENGAYDLGEDVEHVGSGGKAETDAQREGDDDHVAL